MPIKIQRNLCQKSIAGIVRDSIVNIFQNSEYFLSKNEKCIKNIFRAQAYLGMQDKLSARNQE